jgi:hypothetical protein
MWEVERFERDEGYAKDSGEIDLDDGACYKHVTRKGVDVVGKRKKKKEGGRRKHATQR